MSLFLARNGPTYELDKAEGDVLSISTLDTGCGFNEAAPVVIEGVTCVEVQYTRTQTGPTAVRLDALVHDTGFTTPRQIVVMAVPSDTIVAGGYHVYEVGGVAFPIGDPLSPFANHICTYYDADECNGSGHWVDKEGGGTTSEPRDVILYHELAHCFHFATGVTTSEPLAEADENDMRDARGLPHRDTSSHNGGCGGGPSDCCIVASLATGSPYSEEIKRFRYFREHTLRRSRVGDDFFQEFFRRYYGFSPEVTRLMGNQPTLRPLIRQWCVLPLLAGVETLIYYTDHRGAGLAQFFHEQSAREGLAEMYQQSFLEELSGYLDHVRSFDTNAMSRAWQSKGKTPAGFRKLLRHIKKETVEDEYIDWSLVAVVELWVECALLLYSGKPEAELDRETYEKIVHWIGHLPVTEIWGEFSRLETELELQSLEQFLFDPRAKAAFAERLMEKHPRHRETITRWSEGGK